MPGSAVEPQTSTLPPGCASREALEVFALDGSASPEFARHVTECPTCSAALEEIRAENALASELAGVAQAASAAATVPLRSGPVPGTEGELIEGYRLENELHRGGQGVVFRAFQHATKRHVAVKMLLGGQLAGPKELARFEREIELVASLKHPGIVTVYHSGLTSRSQPFVAMELIDGVRLSEYAWRAAGGERGTTQPATGRTGWTGELLRLFVRICQAVHFAHQRGIIHRDLKPSNILVTSDGQPHVLDFGIAKLAGPDAVGSDVTRSGDFVGTFAYAAPEQLAGETGAVDVRTDVYALGVILYEILTGARPYTLDGPLAKIVATVMTVTPPPPARAGHPLDEELSAIVLKALAKEPERRYQSAARFGEDLERYLTHRPIEARRDSRWYVLRKALRRYRVAVAAALIVLALIIGFSITMAVLYVRTTFAETAKAKTLTAIVSLLGEADRNNSNEWISTVTDFLDKAAVIADENLTDYPSDLAMVDTSLGLGYMERDEPAKALKHIERALNTRRQLHKPPHPDIAASLHDLGRVHFHSANQPAAAAAFRAALAMRRQLHPGDHRDTAKSMHFLASALTRLAESKELEARPAIYKEAESLYTQSLEMRERVPRKDDTDLTDLANTLNGLSFCLRKQQRSQEAVRRGEDALDIINRIAGKDDWRVGRVLGTLAAYLIEMHDFDRAEAYLARSLEIKRLEGASQIDLVLTLSKMARLDLRRLEIEGVTDPARLENAHKLSSEAVEIRRRINIGDHPDLAEELSQLGQIEMARSNPGAAERLFQEALDMRINLFTQAHWQVADSESLLSAALARLGRGKAEENMDRAVRKATAALEPGDDKLNRILSRAASVYTLLGRPEKADQAKAELERGESIAAERRRG